MSLNLIKDSNLKKPSLIPLLRPVKDTRGVVFRQYYVDVDKLRKMIREAELNSPPYLSKIPGYKFLIRFLDNKNIKELLQNLFSEDNTSIPPILNRYSRASIVETYSHTRQKLFQNLYAYFLTRDKYVERTIKSYTHSSLKWADMTYDQKDEAPEWDLPKTVTEKTFVRIKPWKTSVSNKPYDVVPEPLLPKIHQDYDNIDYGKRSVYTMKVVQKQDYPGLAGELSRFFNYLHPSPQRTILMVSKVLLVGAMEDKDYLVNNLTLASDIVYSGNSDYWTTIISRCLLNTNKLLTELENCDQEKRLYQYLLLKNIDEKVYDSVSSLCPPPIAIDDKIDDRTDLTINQRMYLLASKTEYTDKEKELLNKTSTFDEFIRYLSALAPIIIGENTDVIGILIEKYKDIFSLHSLFINLKKVQIDNEPPNFLYFILQLFGATMFKQHYLPYNRIGDTRNGPFAPYLSLKLREAAGELIRQQLLGYRSQYENSYKKESDIQVVLPFPNTRPKDNQLFIRAEPFMVLPLLTSISSDTEGVAITISKKNVLYSFLDNNRSFVVIGNLIKSIVPNF